VSVLIRLQEFSMIKFSLQGNGLSDSTDILFRGFRDTRSHTSIRSDACTQVSEFEPSTVIFYPMHNIGSSVSITSLALLGSGIVL
jgi:hypothetical protein